ncbi:MAG: hypothetical protein QXL17_08045 [Candidatus Thermoplasmatota archaeon]
MIEPYSKEEEIYVQKLVRKHQRKKKMKFIFFGCFIVFVCCLGVFLVVSTNALNREVVQDDFKFDQFGWSKTKILTVVEEYIRPQLRFPTTGVFSDERVVLYEEKINYNCYKVTGVVESLNSFGIKIKQSFQLLIFCYAYDDYEIRDFSLA